MNYLIDTNIFLEILLGQNKSKICKSFLNSNSDNLYISDFSLHSIGVILFKFNQDDIFNMFIKDIFPSIKLISLSIDSYQKVSENLNRYNLDFDDSYQASIANENNFTIVTMDKDFKKIKDVIPINFI